jgi:hypothetical protein
MAIAEHLHRPTAEVNVLEDNATPSRPGDQETRLRCQLREDRMTAQGRVYEVADRPKAELPAILREIATNVRELAPKAQQVTFS